MIETLDAIVGDQMMGALYYKQDRLTFRYCDSWREHPAAFPLSLSMPLTASR